MFGGAPQGHGVSSIKKAFLTNRVNNYLVQIIYVSKLKKIAFIKADRGSSCRIYLSSN